MKAGNQIAIISSIVVMLATTAVIAGSTTYKQPKQHMVTKLLSPMPNKVEVPGETPFQALHMRATVTMAKVMDLAMSEQMDANRARPLGIRVLK